MKYTKSLTIYEIALNNFKIISLFTKYQYRTLYFFKFNVGKINIYNNHYKYLIIYLVNIKYYYY